MHHAPSTPSTPRSNIPLAHTSARLAEPWIEAAVEGTRPARSGWSDRLDGWTPDRIRIFLVVLAECGVVGDAARAAGMSRQNAYALRNSARGRDFAFAWRTALLRGRDRLADEVMSRALQGCVDVIVRDGEVWGERHRFDNRLTMAVLTRLDRLAELRNVQDDAAARVEPEYEELVDCVCEGGKATAVFLRARCPTGFQHKDHADDLDRARRYCETGTGLPEPEPEPEPAPDPAAAAPEPRPEPAPIDWDYLLAASPDPVAPQDEQDEWHPSSLSRSSTPILSSPGFPGEGDRAAVEGPSPSHSSHSYSSHSLLGEGDRPAEPVGGGAGEGGMPEGEAGLRGSPWARHAEGASEPDQPSTPGVGEAGTDTQTPPEARSTVPPPPEPGWILGDDGIAIPTVNGRVPHHLRHRDRGLRN